MIHLDKSECKANYNIPYRYLAQCFKIECIQEKPLSICMKTIASQTSLPTSITSFVLHI